MEVTHSTMQVSSAVSASQFSSMSLTVNRPSQLELFRTSSSFVHIQIRGIFVGEIRGEMLFVTVGNNGKRRDLIYPSHDIRDCGR
jgi:hypothetical protein